MEAVIAHRNKNRARFETNYKFNSKEINAIKYKLEEISGLKSCRISKITGSIIVSYKEDCLGKIARLILDLDVESLDSFEIDDSSFVPQTETDLFSILRDSFEMRFFIKTFVPRPIRTVLTLFRAVPFIKRGLLAIYQKKINVDLLDASAVFLSIISGDFKTASSTMFLLNLGEKLEDWTLKKSKDDLSHILELKIDSVFVVKDGKQVLKNLNDVEVGDLVAVTVGNTIPVDARVHSGIGLVNQASITGESIPVKKEAGSSVFAGTVLEEGSLVIRTTSTNSNSRIQNIINMIEKSEANKSIAQKQAESAADSLVKYSFIGAILTFLFTRNFTRAKAFLMVDYSCALKLTIPIAVMKAINQLGLDDILVKGGKFLESLANADTIVFDKTGTLTKSTPTVEKIIAFGPYSEDESLRIAACLEEHFPHSIANAVVRAAKEKDLHHDEMHSEPEYIVAHGIASTINGKRAVIGSEHFILEDEHVEISDEKLKLISDLKENYSLLFMAIDGDLICVLCITDPIRPDAIKTIEELRKLGFSNICMMTGDAENSASYVAEQLKLDHYKSQVLPEDKAKFIIEEKSKGHKTVMIGDGINDSVALSEADVGISMHKGADLAREISDIAIQRDDLNSLVDIVKLSKAMQNRIDFDYQSIITLNSILILLGFFQVINNTTSSFLHNSLTVLTAWKNMDDYQI